MVLFQMLNISWSRQSPLVQRFQVIAALLGIMCDFVGTFPGWVKLPLGWVFSGKYDFVQDEVSYIKSSELHSLVVILRHLLLVLHHLARCSISGFFQAIQVNS